MTLHERLSQWFRQPRGWIVLAFFCSMNPAVGGEQVRVMTFNLWHGGDGGKQPLSQTIEVIKAAKPDIVGFQETPGFGDDVRNQERGLVIAKELDRHYYAQGDGMGILSRFPILAPTSGKWGVSVQMPGDRTAWIFNVHLMHSPYQPYQLLKIPYENAPFIETAEEAIKEARKARGSQVEQIVSEARAALKKGDPVFLTGDFNEPSYLDWTARAARAGKCPLLVPYPSTYAVAAVGLQDCYRAMFPDEVKHTGWTWTPITRPDDPKDRHDRIDFVFAGGSGLKVRGCEIVGENPQSAHIVVQPWPSDHRAVVATVELP